MNRIHDTIFAVGIKTLEEEAVFQEWMEKMPARRREKILAVRRPEDRRRSLAAGVALYQALFAAVPETAEKIYTDSSYNNVLQEGRYGKPYLSGCGIFFNLSHAGDYAVCVLADREVGIDIERPREIRDALQKRISTPDEVEAVKKYLTEHMPIRMFPVQAAEKDGQVTGKPVRQCVEDEVSGGSQTRAEEGAGAPCALRQERRDVPDRVGTFGKQEVLLRLWTMKESVMKYYGLGLSLPPADIRIGFSGSELRVQIPAEDLADLPEGFCLPEELRFTFGRIGEYPVTICTGMPPFRINGMVCREAAL